VESRLLELDRRWPGGRRRAAPRLESAQGVEHCEILVRPNARGQGSNWRRWAGRPRSGVTLSSEPRLARVSPLDLADRRLTRDGAVVARRKGKAPGRAVQSGVAISITTIIEGAAWAVSLSGRRER
jgi:hypothetical protein